MSEVNEHAEILNKIALCSLVVEEIKSQYEVTPDPDQRADLLIAVEGLAADIADLVFDVRDSVWNNSKL
jgi:hypothetical protein